MLPNPATTAGGVSRQKEITGMTVIVQPTMLTL